MPIEVTPLGRDTFLLAAAPARRVWAVVDGARTWVFLDGRTYIVSEARRHGARHAHGHEDAPLAAPMPATVGEVRVMAGDRVARGDLLVTLEAMKMVLPIVAPRNGVVKAVHCRQGDLVEAGAALVELETGNG